MIRLGQHVFHSGCILACLASERDSRQRKCPNCRAQVNHKSKKVDVNFIPDWLFQSGFQQIPSPPEPEIRPPIPVIPDAQALLMRDLQTKTLQVEQMMMEIEELRYQMEDEDDNSVDEDPTHWRSMYEEYFEKCQRLENDIQVVRLNLRTVAEEKASLLTHKTAMLTQIANFQNQLSIAQSRAVALQSENQTLQKRIEVLKA